MSDVMHGPSVADGNKRRKSYLISFLDDATRVSPFSAFAPAENTAYCKPQPAKSCAVPSSEACPRRCETGRCCG